MRPSRRLAYRVYVAFEADPANLRLAVANPGRLGVHLQARSLTVAGAPYSYTIGAGDTLAVALPNPGSYDLSVHGPNGFFRHFAGAPATVLRVEEVAGPQETGTLRLRLNDGANRRGRSPVVVDVADRYGTDHQIRFARTGMITIDTHDSGGWYDIALTTPGDPAFTYQLAGRLESRAAADQRPAARRRLAHGPSGRFGRSGRPARYGPHGQREEMRARWRRASGRGGRWGGGSPGSGRPTRPAPSAPSSPSTPSH